MRFPDFQSYQGTLTVTGPDPVTIVARHINSGLGFDPPLDNCVVVVNGEFLGYSEGRIVHVTQEAVFRIVDDEVVRLSIDPAGTSYCDPELKGVTTDIVVDDHVFCARASGHAAGAISWRAVQTFKIWEP